MPDITSRNYPRGFASYLLFFLELKTHMHQLNWPTNLLLGALWSLRMRTGCRNKGEWLHHLGESFRSSLSQPPSPNKVLHTPIEYLRTVSPNPKTRMCEDKLVFYRGCRHWHKEE